MWHHQSFLAPRGRRQGVKSSPEFRRRPAHADHGQSLPGVKRREGRAPFVTPTLPAPGVLTCRPTAGRDRRRSSPINYRLSCLQLSRKIIDRCAKGPLAIR